MMGFSLPCFLLALLSPATVNGFSVGEPVLRRARFLLHSHAADKDDNPTSISRREACRLAVEGTVVSSGIVSIENANAEDGYLPAKRPTAYRVDSTQPPTLIPLSSARKESNVLLELGQGSGTDKEAIVDDRVNLNNILNKAVFGSIDALSGVVGAKGDESVSGPGFASFVCLGVPSEINARDLDLVVSLLNPIFQARTASTALGLAFCPLSVQSDLDSYSKSGDESALTSALSARGVPDGLVGLYLPILRFARKKSICLLALSPEREDILTARTQGLQNIDRERRNAYVVDSDGFIALSQDPKFRLYTERSLLKDFSPINANDKAGDFFAERILVHETAATVAAKFSVERPDSLVAIVAPIPDVRFLLGINGRIPRVCSFLNPQQNKVSSDAVTTILLNPTAQETLSKSRYLRLEIGTGPQTLDYQTKVADYLWFSASPRVNLIPRLMNE